MKNRLFALLLVVALVVTVSVFAVGAETTENTFEGKSIVFEAPCQHCKGADCKWAPIPTTAGAIGTWGDSNGTYLSQGITHFYLTGPSTLTQMITAGSAGTTYCFELNGQTWTAQGDIYFFQAYSGGTINIMDRSENGTGVMNLPSTNGNVRHVYLATPGTINQYGGTMTRLAEGNAMIGACVYKVGGTYNMFGGSMRAKTTVNGAAVYMTSGDFNMEDGYMEGKTNANGGAVYMSGGTFNLNGGTITGEAARLGGAVYLAAGSFNMSDGTITGHADQGGGGVCINAAGATFNMTGGSMLDCTTIETRTSTDIGRPFDPAYSVTDAGKNPNVGKGGAVMVEMGTFNMSGGTISRGRASYGGAIAVGSNTAHGIAKISGTAVIEDCYAKMYGGAIAVYRSKYWGPAPTYAHLNYDRSGQLTISGGEIKTNNTAGSLGGAIYVFNVPDDTLNDPVEITGGTIGGQSNGSAGAIYLGGGTVMNVSGGTVTGTTPWDGGAFYLSAGSTLNISGGTITGTGNGGTYNNGASYFVGGGIAATDSSTINMTGGELKNCTTKGIGGAVYLANSTMKMTAGTISGSNDTAAMNALSGGAVFVGTNSTFELDGGTIYQTTSKKGGAIYAEGAADKKANVVFKSGVIDGTKTTDNGGGILLMANSDIQMSGGTIQNTRNKWTGGALVLMNASASATITGGTIQDCVTETDSTGAGLYVCANATISAEGLTIKNCRTGKSSGGNLYIESNTAENITFKNCHFIGSGNAEAPQATWGGSVFVNNANVTFDSCEFTGGVAATNGGNLYVNGSSANVTVTGNSTFSGGKAVGGRGGNIGVYLGKLTLTGDTVVSGKNTSATYLGDNVTVFGTGAALHLSGNVVVKDAPSPVVTRSVAIETGCTVTVDGNINIDDIVLRDTLNDGTMTVEPNFAGKVSVSLENAGLKASIVPGDTVGAWLAQEDGYENTGIIKVYNADWVAKILADNGDNFKVATFGAFKDGVETGLADLSNTGSYDYIKLYIGGNITLTADTTVLLNGQSAHFITNGKKLSVIDTKTDLFNAAGTTFTVEDVNDLVMTAQNNGNQYVVVGNEEDGFTSNRVQVKITGLAVRPSAVGIYYVTTIQANAGVKDYIKTFGTALTVANEVVIDENFDETDGILYTQIDGDRLNLDAEGKATTNSVLIEGILDEKASEAKNAEWSAMPIKAASYIKIDTMGDDEVVVCIMGDVVNESLDDAMELMDAQYEELGAKQVAALNFYTTWLSRGGFADAQLPNLEAAAAEVA